MKKLLLVLLIGMFTMNFGSAAITTTLNSPADESIFYSNPVTFNAIGEVTGGANLINMSLWTNESGSWDIKNTTTYSKYNISDLTQTSENSDTYVLKKTININNYVEKGQNELHGYDAAYYAECKYEFIYEDETTANVENSQNNAAYVSKIYTNPNPNKNVTQIKIYTKNDDGYTGAYAYERNDIVTTQLPTQSTELFITKITESILWNVQSCDSNGDCELAPSNYTLFIDTTSPTIEVETPSDTLNYGTIGQIETLNVTFTDTNLDSCWYNYNGTNISIDGCLTGIKNSTTFILEEDNLDITIYSNDTIGNLNSEYISWDYKILENSRTHNSTSYETASETFSINITANSSLTAVSLIYNGTEYTATQSGTVWSKTMDIPSANLGNNSIEWEFTYSGDTINSDYTTYQNILPINLTYCTSGTPYINFTFKDESDESILNASIPTSTFNYYLGSGDEYKTLTYINNTAHYSYAFCFTPITKDLNLDYRMQYESTNYPQRISEPDTFIINNETTNKILYLLGTVDGIYVTFQVINTADILISGVDITATRTIGSEEVVVASGTTGASGAVTFWLNPDFTHDFSFSKAGYTTYEYSDTPTQTSYTITLPSVSTEENSSFEGILTSILPTDTYLINDTEYTFAFNLTSSVYDVSEYGFSLRLSNGTELDGGSTGTEGTELTLNYNVGNQSVVYMDYYWTINGETTSRTTKWIIFNEANTDWSLSNFFDDLDIYLDSGIFGLDDFGRNLIVFLVLFISIGIMSFKYGFTSPMSIFSMIFGIVFFMDVMTPIMPDVVGMANLPTFLAGLILILVVINEVRLR